MIAKRKKRRVKARGNRTAPAAPVHPLIVQADIPAAQRARATFAVQDVPSPNGAEVIQAGVLRIGKAVRRVPAFEALAKAKVIDERTRFALEWYADALAASRTGLFKCPLGNAGQPHGGGGKAEARPLIAAQGLSNISWAQRGIEPYLLPVFIAVMHEDMTFAEAGAECFPSLCADRAARRASAYFKAAAGQMVRRFYAEMWML